MLSLLSLLYSFISELGYHFFDVHRNIFYGFASILTLLSTALFLFGASALSNQNEVISMAHWAILTATNSTNNAYVVMNLGLNAVLFHFCPTETSNYALCRDELISYSSQACSSGGFLGDVCTACEEAATAEATAAAFAAFSKFLALGNMQIRMYTAGDSSSFKIFSIVVEIVGIISLLTSLSKFEYGCIKALNEEMEDKSNKYTKSLDNVQIDFGSAFLAFAFGVIASGLRLILHVLTPLPRRGKGIFTPLKNLFSQCDGCLVLYEDDLEDQKRREALGIRQPHVKIVSNDDGGIVSNDNGGVSGAIEMTSNIASVGSSMN